MLKLSELAAVKPDAASFRVTVNPMLLPNLNPAAIGGFPIPMEVICGGVVSLLPNPPP
jgi:hypothetical protein